MKDRCNFLHAHQRLHVHTTHNSFISYLKSHYITAVLNINFPSLQRRPSFLVVALMMPRPLRSRQVILSMLTTFLGKNRMLAQEVTEEILGKNMNKIITL